jgi:hypothetical protein
MLHLFAKNRHERLGEIILICLLLQLVWFLWPRVSSGHPSPRVSQAIEMHARDSESVQTAAIAEAIRLDSIEHHRWAFVRRTFLFVVDTGAICLYLIYGKRRAVA